MLDLKDDLIRVYRQMCVDNPQVIDRCDERLRAPMCQTEGECTKSYKLYRLIRLKRYRWAIINQTGKSRQVPANAGT